VLFQELRRHCLLDDGVLLSSQHLLIGLGTDLDGAEPVGYWQDAGRRERYL
jgi:hypothetical protein